MLLQKMSTRHHEVLIRVTVIQHSFRLVNEFFKNHLHCLELHGKETKPTESE